MYIYNIYIVYKNYIQINYKFYIQESRETPAVCGPSFGTTLRATEERLIQAKDQHLAEAVQAYQVLYDEAEVVRATLQRVQRESQVRPSNRGRQKSRKSERMVFLYPHFIKPLHSTVCHVVHASQFCRFFADIFEFP